MSRIDPQKASQSGVDKQNECRRFHSHYPKKLAYHYTVETKKNEGVSDP
jgi:hypothetical protein